MSIMVSFCAVLFPTSVLDEILNLIESVSEGFPSCSSIDVMPSSRCENYQWIILYYNNEYTLITAA